ncbi:MAG: cardiolipin synthase [Ruminococcus sp.]|nr:cardiolipin synthase [Ruminococcus sp.]
MSRKYDHSVKNSVGRLIFVAVSLLIQIGWMVLLFLEFSQSSIWISALTTLIAIAIVLEIISKHGNAAFKLPWIIVILAFPLVGLVLYLLTGRSALTKHKRRQFERIGNELRRRLHANESVLRSAEQQNMTLANQMRYIQNDSQYPPFHDTDVQFYGDTCQALDALAMALTQAEHFIFMEYHAIEDAKAFGRIRKILSERAAKGVEVRIIYDDVGSVGFISPEFIKRMEKDGIQCRVFNPLLPVINVFMNNRDHRKITVIDGSVGFTGGYNLADEYFNIVQPYGEWKDTGLRLEGQAVRSLTVQFLEMWNTIRESDKDFSAYFPDVPCRTCAKGYVQPFGDSPLDDVYLGENVYMNMVKSAERYIWFMTPYLIIDDEMSRELTLAARRGVDVRILTPGIPDKKIVYSLTRSYYHQLVESGVRIYEFSPGFLHAKQCVCDDHTAVVGTINLDYRSLYFHFENAVFFAECDAVTDVKKDFEQTLPRCCEVTDQYRKELRGPARLKSRILRLFAPLL